MGQWVLISRASPCGSCVTPLLVLTSNALLLLLLPTTLLLLLSRRSLRRSLPLRPEAAAGRKPTGRPTPPAVAYRQARLYSCGRRRHAGLRGTLAPRRSAHLASRARVCSSSSSSPQSSSQESTRGRDEPCTSHVFYRLHHMCTVYRTFTCVQSLRASIVLSGCEN